MGKSASDEGAAIARCEAAIDVRSLVFENPNAVQAMLRMHVIGDTGAEVARDLNISRFQLLRDADRFVKTVQNRIQAELAAAS